MSAIADNYDISGYTQLIQITDAEGKCDDLKLLSWGDVAGRINFSDEMRRLTELYDNGYSSGDDEMKAVISGKSELEDGSALYITNIYANGDRSSIDDPEYISITGFLLR